MLFRSGIPRAGNWNGSLWSLIYEVMCYLAVAGIGVAGLANRRWVSPTILALAVFGATLLPPLTLSEPWTIPQLVVRSAITFAAGAFMYQWRDLIPARWSIVAVSAITGVMAAGLLPDYRVVAAIPLAYAVIVSGALIQNKRLNLRTDLSYGMYIYAFPMQQLLAICGLVSLNPLLFFVISTAATLPLAAMSWFLVEKRVMALKSRLLRNWSMQAQREHGSGSVTTAADRFADQPNSQAPTRHAAPTGPACGAEPNTIYKSEPPRPSRGSPHDHPAAMRLARGRTPRRRPGDAGGVVPSSGEPAAHESGPPERRPTPTRSAFQRRR